MDVMTVAVDLAKDGFEVATANRAGRIVERKRLNRRQFEAFVDALPAGTEVVMEACGTAHYWRRRCQAHGHHVRLLPVQYAKPYVRRNKTRIRPPSSIVACLVLIASSFLPVMQAR